MPTLDDARPSADGACPPLYILTARLAGPHLAPHRRGCPAVSCPEAHCRAVTSPGPASPSAPPPPSLSRVSAQAALGRATVSCPLRLRSSHATACGFCYLKPASPGVLAPLSRQWQRLPRWRRLHIDACYTPHALPRARHSRSHGDFWSGSFARILRVAFSGIAQLQAAALAARGAASCRNGARACCSGLKRLPVIGKRVGSAAARSPGSLWTAFGPTAGTFRLTLGQSAPSLEALLYRVEVRRIVGAPAGIFRRVLP